MKKLEMKGKLPLGGVKKIILNDDIDVEYFDGGASYYDIDGKQYLIIFYAEHLKDISNINKVMISLNIEGENHIKMIGDIKILKKYTTGQLQEDYNGYTIIITNSNDDVLTNLITLTSMRNI